METLCALSVSLTVVVLVLVWHTVSLLKASIALQAGMLRRMGLLVDSLRAPLEAGDGVTYSTDADNLRNLDRGPGYGRMGGSRESS